MVIDSSNSSGGGLSLEKAFIWLCFMVIEANNLSLLSLYLSKELVIWSYLRCELIWVWADGPVLASGTQGSICWRAPEKGSFNSKRKQQTNKTDTQYGLPLFCTGCCLLPVMLKTAASWGHEKRQYGYTRVEG